MIRSGALSVVVAGCCASEQALPTLRIYLSRSTVMCICKVCAKYIICSRVCCFHHFVKASSEVVSLKDATSERQTSHALSIAPAHTVHGSSTWDNNTRRRGTSVATACCTGTRPNMENRYDVGQIPRSRQDSSSKTVFNSTRVLVHFGQILIVLIVQQQYNSSFCMLSQY